MPNPGNFPLQPNDLDMTRAVLVSEGQSGSSKASMPNARPWRRGQAPKPRSGAPKAQGWTAAPTVAAQSFESSVAAKCLVDSTGTDVPMSASATPRIHTTLTGTTRRRASAKKRIGVDYRYVHASEEARHLLREFG